MHNFAFFVRKIEYLCMFFLELWKKYCSFVGEREGVFFFLYVSYIRNYSKTIKGINNI